MKLISLLFLAAAVGMSGCSASRRITVMERTIHDTIYLNTVRYDSIYIDKDYRQERHQDTLYITDTRHEYRLRLLHDTTYIHRTDTIPVIKEVPVIKKERYIPWYMKVLAAIGAMALIYRSYREVIGKL